MTDTVLTHIICIICWMYAGSVFIPAIADEISFRKKMKVLDRRIDAHRARSGRRSEND